MDLFLGVRLIGSLGGCIGLAVEFFVGNNGSGGFLPRIGLAVWRHEVMQ